jgi:hypothetical protein
VCYGYDTKAFISNMYDDNILVGEGGVSAPGFVWGLPHTKHTCRFESPLAGANRRYRVQLEVEIDTGGPHPRWRPWYIAGAALDATWVQLDETEAIHWAEGAVSAVSRATWFF